MQQFVSFPDIGQFRNLIQGVVHRCQYVGKDENGVVIYDSNRVLPTMKFKGTCKLHGTNMGIGVHGEDYWIQSRENIITPVKDNAGCAAWWSNSDRKQIIMDIVKDIRSKNSIDDDKIVMLFGEWAGKGVQKSVAISDIGQKAMFLFGVRVVSQERDENGNYNFDKWLDISGISNKSVGLYNIEDYQKWEIEVDLNRPEMVIPIIEDLVNQVETECPVSKQEFGVSGVGEGIVWSCEWEGVMLRFKTKGEKHSVVKSKDKKVATVDVEKMNSVNEFVSYAVTEARLEQGIEKVFTQHGIPPVVEKTGDFLKWVVGDIVKEELDTISGNGLCVKDITGPVSKAGRDWFFKYLNKLVFERN